MAAPIDGEDLIANWTVVEADWPLIGNKAAATRLGFTLLLLFFASQAKFPAGPADIPDVAVAYVAEQVRVDPRAVRGVPVVGADHRVSPVPDPPRVRVPGTDREAKLADWLARDVCGVEFDDARRRAAVISRCCGERIEPPAPTRLDRILGAAQAAFDRDSTATVCRRLPETAVTALDELAAAGGRGVGLLVELRADPGQPSLDTVLAEIGKLDRIRALGLPAGLFDGYADALVDAWRARAARLFPSELRARPQPTRITLLASLCHARTAELVDSHIDLLIAQVHRLTSRAQNKVSKQQAADPQLPDRDRLLGLIAQAALANPEGSVREVVYP